MGTPSHETGDTKYERDDDSLADKVREKANDAKERVEDEPFERDEDETNTNRVTGQPRTP